MIVQPCVDSGPTLHDAIAFANAAGFGRCVRIDLRDGDEMRLRVLLDQHTEAAVAATRAAVELLEVLGSEQLAVRIVELSHQPARGLFVHVGCVGSVSTYRSLTSDMT